jgi:voltage-gated potassium channel
VQGLKKAARQADKNGDDQLDFEEFVELMSATVFTIFYILFAICIVAGVVNHSSEVVMGWYERRMKQVNLSVIAKAAEAVDVFADRYGCSCGFWILTGKRIGKTVLCMLLPVLVGSIVIGFNEDWSWLDALYWSVVTSTTVGYGDLKLTQESSRIFTTVYLLIGLSFIGAGVANLAALRVELHLASETRHMVQRFLAMDIVSELDLDGNGVDQCEFVCGMLLQLQLVDPSTVEGLLQMFEGLDSSGSGVLTHEGLTQLCVSRHPADPHTCFSRSLKAEATMAV